ncbi:endonuclease/exonuclease/phosphatase family protein [Candidatus Dojkabacteria bacterium]|nr:endonuclease/exonuclease/phosphatase family protein [Candidatus Dojkabacteria bacterium]
METKTSSLFNELQNSNKHNFPRIFILVAMIAVSFSAFMFANNLRMNSDVAPEGSEASEIFRSKACKWDIECGIGSKCSNNECLSKPIPIPSNGNSSIYKRCKSNQDCYPFANTCEKLKCKIIEYPSNGQNLILGGGYMFKRFISGSFYYQYSFSQNNKVLLTTNLLTNDEYGIWPDNIIYKTIKPGKLEVLVKGWDKTKKSFNTETLTVQIVTPTPILSPTPRPTPTLTPTLIPTPTPPISLKVMTYNIYQDDNKTLEEHRLKIRAIANYIKTNKIDIAGLQELSSIPEPDVSVIISEELASAGYPMNIFVAPKRNENFFQNIIISRYPFTQTSSFGQNPCDSLGCDRAILVGKTTTPIGNISFINTHVYHRNNCESLIQYQSLIQTYFSDPNAIFVGDFNTDLDGNGCSVRPMDIFSYSCTNTSACTSGELVDWIFLSKTVSNYKQISRVQDRTLTVSDHFPIISQIQQNSR